MQKDAWQDDRVNIKHRGRPDSHRGNYRILSLVGEDVDALRKWMVEVISAANDAGLDTDLFYEPEIVSFLPETEWASVANPSIREFLLPP